MIDATKGRGSVWHAMCAHVCVCVVCVAVIVLCTSCVAQDTATVEVSAGASVVATSSETAAVSADTHTTDAVQVTHEVVHDAPTAGSFRMQAPLNATYESPQHFDKRAYAIELCVEVDAQQQRGLGIGLYLSDDEGHWLCVTSQQPLQAGIQTLTCRLDTQAGWVAPSSTLTLTPYHRQLVTHFGCYVWGDISVAGAKASPQRVQVHACRLLFAEDASESAVTVADKKISVGQIYDVQLEDCDATTGTAQLQTGARWQMRFLPHPLPDFPYNTRSFKADLVLVSDAGETLRIPAFYTEPMQMTDVGDGQHAAPVSEGYFCVRFRPRHAARYNAHLELSWDEQETQSFAVPELLVTGDDWDNYVRTDTTDSRFLAVDGKFFWPTGINLKSAHDDWSQTYLNTTRTLNKGTITYDAYLQRLALAGGNMTEIWLSNWNLCLEWNDQWSSHHGLNGYSEKHAQQLDTILAQAERNNIRVILSFRNHGQAHSRTGNRHTPSDTNEWQKNPYNAAVGGFLNTPEELFTDAQALQRQQDMHRYICARYGDSPAIMMWKMWSEVDLVDTAKENSHKRFKPTKFLETWHRQMSAHLSAIDIYNHLICAHFSTDYCRVDTTLFKMPDITAVCLNAYLWRLAGVYGRSYTLVQLLHDSVHKRGTLGMHTDILKELAKPIIVSEYGGGNPNRMDNQELSAHILSGPWASMVSGYATGPLFWWSEWVDQGDHWHSMNAVPAFLQGEDLRGAEARSVRLRAQHAQQKIWCYAWARPGCVLLYAAQQRWAEHGRAAPLVTGARIRIGKKVAAGRLSVEWWDASMGTVIAREIIEHSGGNLEITTPDFRRHLACKLKRL